MVQAQHQRMRDFPRQKDAPPERQTQHRLMVARNG
jgi:hypothetical protein